VTAVPDHPSHPVAVGHVEPVGRRIRAVLAGVTVLDTMGARYVWERPAYPQYYIPLQDVLPGALVGDGDGGLPQRTLRVGEVERPGAARVHENGTVRFRWDAFDAWYEEDERVFVHPRSPYVRVDAQRSTRAVRIELGGVVLAESDAPVMVFETGLPARTYLDRGDVRFEHLEASDTVTACPYKGVTSGYWSARVGDAVQRDIAWTYDFPTAPLLPIAGLVAFYDERVTVIR
jgi:uncharacterized protein (DUF427 family)